MNKFINSKLVLIAFLIGAVTFSCSSDDNSDIAVTPDTTETFDAELFVSEEGNDARDVSVTVNANTGTEITSKVTFKTVTNSMRRLYITEEINGAAPVPFQFTSQEVDEKADGSLDLVGDDKKDFEFKINLPAPAADAGSIVYTFWATTGRGDFRDISKRNAIDATAVGKITVTGSGTDSTVDIKEYTQTMLAAPLADGTSGTFLSLFDGTVYKINEGVTGEEGEKAALWDIGYYYGATQNASLASPNDYPTSIVDVPTISGIAVDDLNKAYFALSSLTVAEFDAVATASDLNNITASTNQVINGLVAGNIVEFVDNYGNKGLIKVDEVSGTFNSGDFIKITVKVQL